jgi:hypothetical protein
MKKQLFTLALLALGYIASSHGMGVALLAHMNRINETMAPNTTQIVRGVNAYVVSQTPKVAGQTVIEIEKIVSGPNKGKYQITSKDPGTAAIVIEKTIAGHTKKVHYAEHDITVKGSAKDKDRGRVTDEDGLVVESIEDEGIMVDGIYEEEMHPTIHVNEVEDDVINMRDDAMSNVE